MVDARPQILDAGVEAVEAFVGIAPIHVAQRHDVLACEVDQIAAAHAADSNAGDVQGVARRSKSMPEDMPGHDCKRGTARADVRQKRAPGHFFLLFLFAHDILPCLLRLSRARRSIAIVNSAVLLRRLRLSPYSLKRDKWLRQGRCCGGLRRRRRPERGSAGWPRGSLRGRPDGPENPS